MVEKKQREIEQVLGEADVAEILERAIKLDGARDATVTVDQLREVALEVGVSPSAFSQALVDFGREHTPQEEPPAAEVPAPRFRSWIRTGLSVLFGSVLGATAGIMDGPYLNEETWALAVILLSGASLRLVLSHKKEKVLLPYIIDVIWLWSSFAVVTAMITDYLGEESIIATLVGITMASVVGGWIMKKAAKEGAAGTVRTVRLELAPHKTEPTD
jgi:hypothetical protein